MKTIGLIGGMSWESTQTYYQLLNQGVNRRLGGHSSAKILLNSLNFAEIEALQQQANWQQMALIIGDAARSLERAGAEFIMLCTNTMHKVVPEVEQMTHLPILHIADATAHEIRANNISKIGLLGTRFTMQEDFYKGRLLTQFGIDSVIPNISQQDIVHDVIYHELCLGRICQSSKQRYLEIIDDLRERGAQAIVLGCTEISMLVNSSDTAIPLFDTTAIHAQHGIEWALRVEQELW